MTTILGDRVVVMLDVGELDRPAAGGKNLDRFQVLQVLAILQAQGGTDKAEGGTLRIELDRPVLSAGITIASYPVDPVSGVVEPSATETIVLTFDATGLTIGECYNARLKVEYNDPYIVEEYIPVEMCVVEAFRYYLPIITKAYP